MNPVLKLISLLILALACVFDCDASGGYPAEVGERARYDFIIEMPKAYVSGILVMARTEPDRLSASLINEFGFCLLDMQYDVKKDKIKLVNVTKKLDKWYIKRTLKSDLKHVFRLMREGEDNYLDEKHKIKYTFLPLNDSAQ